MKNVCLLLKARLKVLIGSVHVFCNIVSGIFFFGWIMRDWMEKELCSMMHIILLTLYYYPTSSSIKMYVMKLALQCFCKPSTFIFAFCSIFNGYYYYDFFQ